MSGNQQAGAQGGVRVATKEASSLPHLWALQPQPQPPTLLHQRSSQAWPIWAAT